MTSPVVNASNFQDTKAPKGLIVFIFLDKDNKRSAHVDFRLESRRGECTVKIELGGALINKGSDELSHTTWKSQSKSL